MIYLMQMILQYVSIFNKNYSYITSNHILTPIMWNMKALLLSRQILRVVKIKQHVGVCDGNALRLVFVGEEQGLAASVAADLDQLGKKTSME